MKKFRLFLGLIFTTMLLLSVAAWYFIIILRLNQILPLIKENIQEMSTLPIKIDGELKFRIFPSPALYLKHIEIGSENNSPYLIKLDNVLLKLHLNALLKSEIIFKLIKAEQFNIFINISNKPENTHIVVASHAAATLRHCDPEHSEGAATSDLKIKSPWITTLSLAKTIEHSLLKDYENIPPNSPKFTIEKIDLNNGTLNIHTPSGFLKITDLHITATHNFEQKFNINTKGYLYYELDSQKNTLQKNTISTHLNLSGQAAAQSISDLNFNGILTATNTYFNNFTIDQINAAVTIKPPNILLHPMVMKLYSGEGFGDINIDTKKNSVSLTQHVRRLDVKNFLQHLTKISFIDGQANFFIHGQFALKSPSITETLTGNGHFDLINGSIKNFNLHVMLKQIRKKIEKLLKNLKTSAAPNSTFSKNTTNPNFYLGETKISLLKIQFSLQHQDLAIGESLLQTEELKLKGTGRYNIETKNIIANVNASFDTGDKALNEISNMLGGYLPITITGPINNPKIMPNIDKISPYIQSIVTKKITNAPEDVIKQQIFQFFTVTPTIGE